MQCWLLFHRELGPDVPEAPEVLRFQQVALEAGIELSVLQPQEFDLIVDSPGDGWSAIYRGRKLPKPDLIIARTAAKPAISCWRCCGIFERQGVAMVNGPAAIEAVADKLQTLQMLSGAGLPIPKTILGKFPVDVDIVERELKFPVVVKTLRGTRGNGVLALCEPGTVQRPGVPAGRCANPVPTSYSSSTLPMSHGRDVRLLVVDGKVIAAMERRAVDGGFQVEHLDRWTGFRICPAA
jgi:gamma-F420-2:alpha-L-glutamate ligase